MRDATQAELEAKRPIQLDTAEAYVDHCLTRLFKDRRHAIGDAVAPDLTYEELIGALLSARDALRTSAQPRRK